ncbi:unnamed protein product [Phyllotreta striolata]|uniref:Major facilitator superfamily (MFS) profile domain-containing protein n=1 Tax=Phyllotreta striolata TaxID=444603 RepID=A0A9P0GRY1_PHYSR|nr:unnamed protein product [Phyllotreta striolata]
MVNSVLSDLAPIIFCMFVGTWSDKFGRKPFLILCLTGFVLSTLINTLIIHFEYVSPWWFVISNIPSSLTGGFTTLLMVISAYLTDVTDDNNRMIRLAIFEAFFALASILGNLSSSYLLYATSYEWIYIIATSFLVLSLLYTIFFIPESRKDIIPFSMKELINTINLKDIIKESFKKRENNTRPYIVTILVFYFVYQMSIGEISVTTLFLRKKLHWTLTKITTVNSVTSVGNVFGALFGTYILYKWLKIKEIYVCLLSFVLLSVSDILRALAFNDYYIYISYVFHIIYVLPILMLKTLMSFMLPPEDMGKIFALMYIIVTFDHMVFSIFYPLIYNATLDINSGIYNYFTLGIHVLVTIFSFVLTRFNFPRYLPPEGEEEKKKYSIQDGNKPTRKISIAVNGIDILAINEKRPIGRPSLELPDPRRLSQNPSIF